jgi:hypothetical protein
MVTAGWCRQPYPGTVNPRTTWMHSARCLPSRHGSRLRADRSKSAYGRKVCTCSQPLLTERDGGRAPPTLQRVPPRSPRRCAGLVFTLTRHEYPRRGRHGFGPPGYPPGTVMKTSRGTPSPRPPGSRPRTGGRLGPRSLGACRAPAAHRFRSPRCRARSRATGCCWRRGAHEELATARRVDAIPSVTISVPAPGSLARRAGRSGVPVRPRADGPTLPYRRSQPAIRRRSSPGLARRRQALA